MVFFSLHKRLLLAKMSDFFSMNVLSPGNNDQNRQMALRTNIFVFNAPCAAREVGRRENDAGPSKTSYKRL
jgi:hypothetical protein